MPAKCENTVIDAAGKLQVNKGDNVADTPKNIVKGEVVYDDGPVQVPRRCRLHVQALRHLHQRRGGEGPRAGRASAGYTFRNMGMLDGFSITANVTNLVDKKYIGTIGSNGFVASGEPRLWFVTLKKAF
jgi:iron complex outermembrane receptor protein